MKKPLKSIAGILVSSMLVTAVLPAVSLAAETETNDGTPKAPVEINDNTFPDKVFRDYITEYYDSDKNGILSYEELESVDTMDINVELGEADLTSIEGIENFFNLHTLVVNGYGLTDLSFVEDLPLTYLCCFDNRLTDLNISKMNELAYLDVEYNKLSSLDISNNPYLIKAVKEGIRNGTAYIYEFWDENQDESYDYYIDLDYRTYLIYDGAPDPIVYEPVVIEDAFPDEVFAEFISDSFDENGDGILDMEELIAVEGFYMEDMDIHSIEGVKVFPYLTWITIVGCEVTEFDVSGMEYLEIIDIVNCPIRSVNLVGCDSLYIVDIESAPLAELDLSNLDKLSQLYLINTNLTTLDISNNSKLRWLTCLNSPIESLDISNNDILIDTFNTTGYEGHGYWGLLDDDGYDYISELNIDDGITVVFDGAPAPQWPDPISIEDTFEDGIFRDYVSNNFDWDNDGKLSYLELSSVDYIDVDGLGINSLKGIGVFTNLVALYCGNNNLDNLDLDGLTKLSWLYCCNNKLESLNINDNPLLIMAFNTTGIDGNGCWDYEGYDNYDNYFFYSLQLDRYVRVEFEGGPEYVIIDPVEINKDNFPDEGFRDYISANYDINRDGILDAIEIASATSIYFADENIESVDGIKNLTYLNSISIHNCNITDFDISGMRYVERIDIFGCPISTLNLDECDSLESITLNSTQLEEIDLSGLDNLRTLCLYDNSITTLDISNNADLDWFTCTNSCLESIDISSNQILIDAFITTGYEGHGHWEIYDSDEDYYISMFSIDDGVTVVFDGAPTPEWPAPISIEDTFDDDIFIDYVKNNFDLNNDGQLSYFEIARVDYINVGDLGIDSLKGINIFTNLDYLYCCYNNIDSLDLSGLTKLSWLQCYNNNLESININDNPYLIMAFDTTGIDGNGYWYCDGYDMNNNYYSASLNIDRDVRVEFEGGPEYVIYDPVEINEDNFPDPIFLNYVYEEYDKDGDYVLSSNEIAQARSLDAYRRGFESVVGIELLRNLENIYLETNNIKEANFSGLEHLRELNIGNNPLESIDISNCPNLIGIATYNTYICEIDITNNPYLIDCFNTTGLAGHGNWDTEVIIGNDVYKSAYINIDPATKLIFDGAPTFEDVDSVVISEWFEDENLAEYVAEELDLDGDGVLSSFEILRVDCLSLDRRDIYTLNGIQIFKNLESLNCFGNNISEIDVSSFKYLIELNCSYNSISDLDFRNNPKLETLYCNSNQLYTLNLDGCYNLTRVDCDNNSIEELDISSLSDLEELDCSSNSISILDISNNSNLVDAFLNGILIKRNQGYAYYRFVKYYLNMLTFDANTHIVLNGNTYGGDGALSYVADTIVINVDAYSNGDSVSLVTPVSFVIHKDSVDGAVVGTFNGFASSYYYSGFEAGTYFITEECPSSESEPIAFSIDVATDGRITVYTGNYVDILYAGTQGVFISVNKSVEDTDGIAQYNKLVVGFECKDIYGNSVYVDETSLDFKLFSESADGELCGYLYYGWPIESGYVINGLLPGVYYVVESTYGVCAEIHVDEDGTMTAVTNDSVMVDDGSQGTNCLNVSVVSVDAYANREYDVVLKIPVVDENGNPTTIGNPPMMSIGNDYYGDGNWWGYSDFTYEYDSDTNTIVFTSYDSIPEGKYLIYDDSRSVESFGISIEIEITHEGELVVISGDAEVLPKLDDNTLVLSYVLTVESGHKHTIVIDEGVEATCTSTGLTDGSHCSDCGDVIVAQEVIPMTAHTTVVDAAVAATCTTTGLTEGSHCNVCGEVLVAQEVIPMKAHTTVVDAAVAATCTTTGLTEGSHCNVCGEVLVAQEVIPMKAHTPAVDSAVEATCTSTGLTEGSHCKVCDEVLVAQEEIPMKAHTPAVDAAVEATCTTTGLTEGSHCNVCGEVLVAQEETPMTAHTPVVDAAVAATCTTTGLTEGSHCNVCGEVLVAQEEIPMKAHTPVVDPAVAATCTTTGLTEGSHCKVCGEVLVAQEVIAAIGHTPVVDAAVEATCTSTGLTEGSHCKVCDEVLVAQEEIPMKAHTPAVDAAVDATCTTTGLTEGSHCSVCGKELSAQEVIAAIGHTPVVDAAVEATCTTTGLTEGSHCSVCGEVLVAQEVIAAIGHTPVVDAAVEATCTTTGLTEGSHCSVCDEVLVAQEVIPMKAHTPAVDAAVEATCITTGLTEGSHCSVCGEVFVAQKEIEKVEHTPVVDTAVEATCATTGLTEGSHCSVCGEIFVAQEEIDKIEHTVVVDPEVPATYTNAGLTEGSHCSACGTVLVSQNVVPKLVRNGWFSEDGKWTYYKDDVKATGWLAVGGVWYYFDNSGYMATSWKQISGTWYYFEPSGSMATGWKQISGIWYYFEPSGSMATGWKQFGQWFYFKSSGAMATGWQQIGSTWYYFGTSGAMVTDWSKIGSSWYYFKSSGAMTTGWLQIGRSYYYFYSSGVMASDTWVGNYHLNVSGVWDKSK